MTLNFDVVGVESDPRLVSWSSKDTMLYALGVGAGSDELAFTTDNTKDTPQRVLPTYAVLASGGLGPMIRKLGADLSTFVHGEQSFELSGELPAEGTVRVTSKVTGIHDKGSGALVVSESTAVDPDTGAVRIVSRGNLFVRGHGGFGGDRGPRHEWAAPDREPDHCVTYETSRDQALIYRLSGDGNPLHSDPAFAQAAGFPGPILHGLCSYGFTGRAVLHAAAAGDPARFTSMNARFSSPVIPGDALTVSIWVGTDGNVLFRTTRQDGTVVLDHGRATVTPDA